MTPSELGSAGVKHGSLWSGNGSRGEIAWSLSMLSLVRACGCTDVVSVYVGSTRLWCRGGGIAVTVHVASTTVTASEATVILPSTSL